MNGLCCWQKTPGMISTRLPMRRVAPCVRAQEVDSTSTDPKFSFKSNSRSGIGFVEEDSAGQTNIFAVQPRQYVAGSIDDENANSGSNAIVGVGGAVLGIAIVGLGITALTTLGGDAVTADDLSQFQTLSEYRAEFESSLVPSAAPELSQ